MRRWEKIHSQEEQQPDPRMLKLIWKRLPDYGLTAMGPATDETLQDVQERLDLLERDFLYVLSWVRKTVSGAQEMSY